MILPPIDTSGLNVLELPVKPRPSPEEGAMLQPVAPSKCQHLFATYEVDVDAARCRCKRCGDEVSPFFVLERLMRLESRWMQTRAAYQDEMKRLGERSKTKCRNCGEMTEISRR